MSEDYDRAARNNVRSALNVLEDLENNVKANLEDLLFSQEDSSASEEYLALAAIRRTVDSLLTFSAILFDETHTVGGAWN